MVNPKKHLSQFFLTDSHYQKKLSDSIVLDDQDCIVEIGSGRGELTHFLIAKQCKVYCIEVDKVLCKLLSAKFRNVSQVTIICDDIRKFNPSYAGAVAVGNLPYHLSFQIIEWLISNRVKVKRAYFTFEKAFASKLIAKPGRKEYGYLASLVSFYADAKVLFNIPKSCFWPQPKVDSSLVELTMYPKAKFEVRNEANFIEFLRNIFMYRRKKIINILKRLYPCKEWAFILQVARTSPDLRPECMSLSELIKIYHSLAL